MPFSCLDGDHDMGFWLNEQPLLIPGCDLSTKLCKLSFILRRYQRFINANCEQMFCSSD